MKLNNYPALGEHATAKYYVNQSIDEPTLDGNNNDNDFNIFN